MSQDPRIEAAARQVAAEHGYPAAYFPDGMAEVHAKSHREQAARIIAAADKAATITTVEGLDALPEDAVIIADTVAYQKCGDHWDGAGRTWDTGQLVSDLPARVIHWGTE